MPNGKRREFDQKTRTAIAERSKVAGVMRCEGTNFRTPGRCFAVIKKGQFQIDHIIADWSDDRKTKLKPEDGQILCDACYSIKNPKDTSEFHKSNRVKARDLGVYKPKQTFPKRPKPEKKPPKPQVPRRGGLAALVYGKER